MTAALLKEGSALLQRVKEVHPLYTSSRPLPHPTLHRDHHRGTVVPLHQPGRDNSDNPLMPPL